MSRYERRTSGRVRHHRGEAVDLPRQSPTRCYPCCPGSSPSQIKQSSCSRNCKSSKESRSANSQAVDRDGLVAFFGSMGWIGGLPYEERLALLTQIRERPTAWDYRLRFETHIHWTRLADS